MSEPDELHLTELVAPRRTRYFAGRLIGVDDLQREQAYGRGHRAHLGRLVLGAGVVCGLEVTASAGAAGTTLRVEPGLAIDGWGRGIVVPAAFDIALQPPDDAGAPGPGGAGAPARLELTLRYAQCGADEAPVPGGGPEPDREATQATTWLEGYCAEVRPASPPAPSAACPDTVMELVRAGRAADALALVVRDSCAAPPDDPRIVLATLTVDGGGDVSVDALAPAPAVPTNLALLRLIACLAARVEELASRLPEGAPGLS